VALGERSLRLFQSVGLAAVWLRHHRVSAAALPLFG
jgi:hypothetical protein